MKRGARLLKVKQRTKDSMCSVFFLKRDYRTSFSVEADCPNPTDMALLFIATYIFKKVSSLSIIQVRCCLNSINEMELVNWINIDLMSGRKYSLCMIIMDATSNLNKYFIYIK